MRTAATTSPRRRLAGVVTAALAVGALTAADGPHDRDSVVDTGVAAAHEESPSGDHHLPLRQLTDGSVAFLADEAVSGDLNADGDTADAVLQVSDKATGVTRNLGHAVSSHVGHWAHPHAGVAELPDGRLAFVSGSRLLVHDRGDGSTKAVVEQGLFASIVSLPTGEIVVRRGAGSSRQSLLVFDPATDRVVDTGIDGFAPRATRDGFVTATPVDVDGDGAPDDVRIATWDLATATARVFDTTALHPPETLVDGLTAAFVAHEQTTGDVNGDGDSRDAVAAVIDLQTGTVTSSGRVLRRGDDEHPFTALPDGRVAFVSVGPGGAEHVLFDPATGQVTATGLPAPATPHEDTGVLSDYVAVGDGHVALRSGGTVHVLALADDTTVDTGVAVPWTSSFVAVTDDGRLALVGRAADGRSGGFVHRSVDGQTTEMVPPRRVTDWNAWSVAAVGDDIVYAGEGVGVVVGGHTDSVPQIVRVLPDGTSLEVDVAPGWQIVSAGTRLAVAATTLQLATLDPTPDTIAPSVGAIFATPDPVEDGEPMTVGATVQDSGGTVAGAAVSIDGVSLSELALSGSPAVHAADGAFDEVSERVQLHLERSPSPGVHELCFWAWDEAGNDSIDSCTTFEVLAGEGPVVTELTATPEALAPGGTVDVAATIDDTETGGAFVSGGVVAIDGVDVAELQPEPGGEFDMPVEYGEATVGPLEQVGDYDVCVRGVDRNGNWSAQPACVTISVLDVEAPLVTGLHLEPDELAQGDVLLAQAVASDAGRGGGAIAGALATVDGVAITVNPSDGTFDESDEELLIELTSDDTAVLEPGRHQLCVTASDAAGNASTPLCHTFTVTGDAVEGSGTIAVPEGSGSFEIDIVESDGQLLGTVDFRSSLMTFHGSVITALEVQDSSSANIDVEGTTHAGIPCTAVVAVVEGTAGGPETGHFAIELRCGPAGLVSYSAGGPLTTGSTRVDGT